MTVIWREFAVVHGCVRVIRSVRLTSCFISTQKSQSKVTVWPFHSSQSRHHACLISVGADTSRHARVDAENRRTHSLNRKMKVITQSSKHTKKSSFCNLPQLCCASSILRHVYLLDPQWKTSTELLCYLNSFWYFRAFGFYSKTSTELRIYNLKVLTPSHMYVYHF